MRVQNYMRNFAHGSHLSRKDGQLVLIGILMLAIVAFIKPWAVLAVIGVGCVVCAAYTMYDMASGLRAKNRVYGKYKKSSHAKAAR